MAVAQKMGTYNGPLVNGNKDQNLRNPDSLILSWVKNTYSASIFPVVICRFLLKIPAFLGMCSENLGLPTVNTSGFSRGST